MQQWIEMGISSLRKHKCEVSVHEQHRKYASKHKGWHVRKNRNTLDITLHELVILICYVKRTYPHKISVV